MNIKELKYTLYLWCCIPAFWGCTGDNDGLMELPAVGVSPVFHPQMEQAWGNTRAIDQIWEQDDEIGITMLSDGTELTSDDVFKTYIVDGESPLLVPSISSDVFYFPPANKVNFVAYYPYIPQNAGAMTVTYNNGFADQSSLSAQKAIDVLYSEGTTAYNKDDVNVSLNFRHVLSKLIIKVIQYKPHSYYESDLSNMKIQVTNLPSSVVMDLKDGSVSQSDVPEATTVSLFKKEDELEYQAIIVPHAATDGENLFQNREIVFTANGKSIVYSLPAECTFASGKEYTFSFRLSQHTISGNMTIYSYQNKL